jgi:hypothetical protein
MRNSSLGTGYMPPPHFIVLSLIARKVLTMDYDLLSSSLYSISYSPSTSHDLALKFSLSTPDTATLKLYSSHNVEDQVSHSYKITGEG